MGIGKLLSCFSHGVDAQTTQSNKLAGGADHEFVKRAAIDGTSKDIIAVGSAKYGMVDGGADGISDHQDGVSLPPLPYGKKLSKRKLAKLQKAEEEAEKLAKAEEEETLSQYLGKSASCSSLNSLPHVLSSSSLSRCVTPERKTKSIMVQFDDQGKVVVRNRQGSIGSDASWPMSTPSSLMATPDCSDLLGLGVGDRLEMSDLTSVSHSVSATEFSPSLDDDGLETMEFIPKAIRSVSNPRFGEVIAESVFKNDGRTVVVGGASWQRGYLGQGADGADAPRAMSAQDPLRRNVSWSHMSEISLSMRRSSSEALLNRRHTVLVLTNDVEDDCMPSDEEEAGRKTGSEKDDGTVDKRVKKRDQLPRKVCQVFESHHVHLSKLQEQMGDADRAPEDLLQLMSRKIFGSRSDISSISDDIAETMEDDLRLTPQTLSSHDLSECSDRLPRIRTS